MGDKAELNIDPIFVVGMPRSGTTLLTTIINASGRIFIPEETHIYQVYEQYLKRKIDRQISFSQYYFSEEYNFYLKFLNLSDSDILLLKNKGRKTRKEVLEDFISIKFEGRSNLLWGEKTPIHFNYINWIKEDYPHSKIVVIHRDPRDVFDSIRKAEWEKFFNAKKRVNQYKKCTELFSDKNLYHIRYEDLLNNKSEISSLGKFLNLDLNDELNINKQDLNFALAKEPWKVNNLKKINKSLAYKWKRRQKTFLDLYLAIKLKKEVNILKYEQFENPNKIVVMGLNLYYWGIFCIYRFRN